MSRMVTTIPPMGSSRWLAATTSRSIVFPSARTVRISRETDSRRRATRSLNRARTGSTLERVEQPEGVEPDDVADVVAEQPLGRGADEDEPAVGADHRHHVELLLAEGVEPGLRRPGRRPVAVDQIGDRP